MRQSVILVVVLLLVACGGKVVADPCESFAGCEEPTPAPRTEPRPAPSPAPNGDDELAPQGCPGPYHVATDDDRCVWSCSEGTQPDPTGGIECTCAAGLTEVDTDRFGRRVCR